MPRIVSRSLLVCGVITGGSSIRVCRILGRLGILAGQWIVITLRIRLIRGAWGREGKFPEGVREAEPELSSLGVNVGMFLL